MVDVLASRRLVRYPISLAAAFTLMGIASACSSSGSSAQAAGDGTEGGVSNQCTPRPTPAQPICAPATLPDGTELQPLTQGLCPSGPFVVRPLMDVGFVRFTTESALHAFAGCVDPIDGGPADAGSFIAEGGADADAATDASAPIDFSQSDVVYVYSGSTLPATATDTGSVVWLRISMGPWAVRAGIHGTATSS